MTRPQIIVRVAFQESPTLGFWTLADPVYSKLGTTTILSGSLSSTPIWTDVSAYLDGTATLSIRRGRDDERGVIQTGRLTLTLNNQDGRFTPGNTSSPYYPYVKPRRRIQVLARWSGTDYPLFTGFVERWPPTYGPGRDSRVTLTAADGFKVLTNIQISGVYPSEASRLAVARVLNAVGWPTADRDIASSSQATIVAQTLNQKGALKHLQDIARAENGQLFMSGAGEVVFQNRHYRLTTTTAPVATFGDDPGGGELPIADVDPVYDDSTIYNQIIVTRTGGTAQTVNDTASQDEYMVQTYSESDLLCATDPEAEARANWLLARYKQPDLRLKALTLNGELNPTSIWPHALGLDISGRVLIRLRLPGSAMIERDSHIEAVEHRITREKWLTTWQLSPAEAAPGWVLGSATRSVLGSTTIPVY